MARMLSVFFTRRPRFSHLNKKTTVYIDGGFFVSDSDNFARSFNLQQGGKVRTSGEHTPVCDPRGRTKPTPLQVEG
ncbi:hypothetical protein Q4R38_00240 [Morganella morganii]|uniref:hypothetical protein n=1 Tax=Morganella morganii TaxID=582 RepID=UPI0005672A0B|nr:hypothetical protein [Morganella morganii]AVK35450.1 hypothetical protein CSB69_0297 [Morganella morganii]ELO7535258.1 hypothetical protein [Morganella morganii]MBM7212108.1 hypothetical protein [Morganella morganii]MBN4019578.1 hypothetical protein [Morganella morganii]MBO8064387.1 hypothetical protein [Morganella morganii]